MRKLYHLEQYDSALKDCYHLGYHHDLREANDIGSLVYEEPHKNGIYVLTNV